MTQVSVLMPVRNAADTLACAVESIRAQSLTDFELIVVDDGSTDASAGLVAETAAKDARIRLLARPARGLVPALNEGLAAARGVYVARMDADDEAHPDRLLEQALALDARPELGLVGCQVAFGGDPETAGGFARHVDWQNALLEPDDLARERFIEAPFAHPSVMFRRALVERHGGYFDGPFPEDYELWLRWMDAGVKMAKVPRKLLTWNDPPGRLTRTDLRYDAEAFFRVKAYWLARWLKANVGGARPIWIWGAGRPTRRRARYLEEHGVKLAGWIDVDRNKVGKAYGGLPCRDADGLPPPANAFVLGYTSKWGARENTRRELKKRGWVEGRDSLMAA